MTISEKVAYLKGLAEGLGIDAEQSKEGKIIQAVIGILDEMAMSIEDLEDSVEELGEGLDAISDDLEDVEEVLFEEEDDEDEDEYDDEDEDGEDFFQVECPNCGDDLYIDQSILEAGSIECPGCKGKFALDIDDGCGDCCGHGHHHGHHHDHEHEEVEE